MYIQAIREASFEIFTTICKLFNEFILDTELKFRITASLTHLTIEWERIVAHVAGLLQEFLTLLSKAKDRSARLNSKIMVPQTITPPPVSHSHKTFGRSWKRGNDYESESGNYTVHQRTSEIIVLTQIVHCYRRYHSHRHGIQSILVKLGVSAYSISYTLLITFLVEGRSVESSSRFQLHRTGLSYFPRTL